MDDSTSREGSISVNGVAKGQDGQLIIQSMSVEDQGRYECCVGDQCKEIAIISESESVRISPYAALAVHPIQYRKGVLVSARACLRQCLVLMRTSGNAVQSVAMSCCNVVLCMYSLWLLMLSLCYCRYRLSKLLVHILNDMC